MTPLEELRLLLRPAAGGLHLVSSGRAEQIALQLRLYRAENEEEVQVLFREGLERIVSARVVVLGIPSDVGAGYRRGANLGPQSIRARLLDEDEGFPEWARAAGIVDVGDVICVPQLLHDEMLSEPQKEATRRALYPGAAEAARLPVSPLSIAERALDLVLALSPRAAPLLLGGDHSVAWPAVSALARARPGLGVVQVDAHTDLLEERLGVKICFGTWSYHANEILGRGGRLVQVGIRASSHERGHWEGRHGVRQFWAAEVLADPPRALEAILAHVKASGVKAVYLSNDIDGTDASFADATGTPEPEGLSPDFVVELVRRLGREVGLAGGDVMEVAPGAAPTPAGTERTLSTAVRYFRETIAAITGARV
jgi:agmatinase